MSGTQKPALPCFIADEEDAQKSFGMSGLLHFQRFESVQSWSFDLPCRFRIDQAALTNDGGQVFVKWCVIF